MKLSDIPLHAPREDMVSRKYPRVRGFNFGQAVTYGKRTDGTQYTFKSQIPGLVRGYVSVTNYRNNLTHGWAVRYLDDHLKNAVFYIHGEVKRKVVFSDLDRSVVIRDEHYKKETLHGSYKERLQCGRPSVDAHFKRGELHGRVELYEKGKLRESHRCKNGQLFGNSFFYDTKGNLVQRRTYKKGITTGWCYDFTAGKQSGYAQFNKKGALETWNKYQSQTHNPIKYLEIFTQQLATFPETYFEDQLYFQNQPPAGAVPDW